MVQVGAFQMCLVQKHLKHGAFFVGRIVEHTLRTWISEPLRPIRPKTGCGERYRLGHSKYAWFKKKLKHGAFWGGRIVEHTLRTWISEPL